MSSYQSMGLLNGLADGIRNGLITGMTMRNAQNQQNMTMAMNGLTKDENGNIVPNEQRQSELALKNLQIQRATHEMDPTSQESNTAYGFLKASMPEKQRALLPENMSGADVKDYMGLAKSDIAGNMGLLKIANSNDHFERTEGDKRDKEFEDLANKVNNPSARAALGRYKGNIDKANAVNVLAAQLGMPEGVQAPPNETREQKIARFNKADSRQLYEFAKASDQLTANANATVYGTDHMMPKDMDIAAAKLREYLPIWAGGGKPEDANAGEFIMRYLDSANREGNYYQSQHEKAKKGIAAGYSHLKKANQDRFNEIMDAAESPVGAAANSPQPQASGLLGGAGSGDADHAIGTRKDFGGKTYEFTGGSWGDKNSWKEVK